MIKRFIRNMAVWYLYVGHAALLRALGPRCALALSRGLSLVNWLFVLPSASNRVRATLARILPQVRPDLKVNRVLRRHLGVKHQLFTEWQLHPTARGRRFMARDYRMEGFEHVDAALEKGRGALVVGFHFGMLRMVMPVVEAITGYDTYTHVHHEQINEGQAYGWVIRALNRERTRVEEDGGVKAIHHVPGATFKTMVDLLSKNALVGIAGDGIATKRFVEVPFLGGMIAFPSGPARLAAATGAAIVPVYCWSVSLWTHRLVFRPPIYCKDDSSESVEATVRAYAEQLDELVHQNPWAWLLWRRLEIDENAEGQMRLVIKPLPTEEG